MRALAKISSGRRTKWVVVVAWIILLVVFTPLRAKLPDRLENKTASVDSLPADVQSVQAVKLLRERFPGGQNLPALIVYRHPGGLTDADRGKLIKDATAAVTVLKTSRILPAFGPSASPDQVSPNREVAFTVVPLPTNAEKRSKAIDKLRGVTGEGGGGLKIRITGGAVLQSDLSKTLESADAPLLIATALIVLMILLAIYRSPAIALLPLVTVGVSYQVATGALYLFSKGAGETIDQTAVSLLAVLMFGAGTDYCLLMVARYSADLRGTPDKHDAMRTAIPRAGPAILASGLTVAGALLTLLAANLGTNRILGPVNAIGVLVVLAASLTLLPAMLTIVGRRGFWPSSKLIAFKAGAPAAPTLLPGLGALPPVLSGPLHDQHPSVAERDGIWRRVGAAVVGRPIPALLATILLLAVGAVGLTTYKANVDVVGEFRADADSVDGVGLLRGGFPAGALDPTTIVIQRDRGQVSDADVEVVRRKLLATGGVRAVTPVSDRSRDGRAVRVAAVFSDSPFSDPALRRVERIRAELADVGPGLHGIVGEGSAVRHDYRETASRDQKVIIPLVLAVIFITLVMLLRAIVAPLVLLATVVMSYFGSFGISLVIFKYVFNEPSVNPVLPLLVFVFLVALGVDYNIFLMDRVREEARAHGTREGMLRALTATGPVITSAGIILAATFAVLVTLPLDVLLELGLAVALGVILDTFVVRTVMVPAITSLLGDRMWWPSRVGPRESAPQRPAQPEVGPAFSSS